MDKDFLWLNIRSLPYFRGLLRAVEARFYQDLILSSPVLDLGCGDGHFGSIAFPAEVEVGIDPWVKSLKKAAKTQAYHMVVCGNGTKLPFSDGDFNAIVSNSVLEHIENIDNTLQEISRVLAVDGLFVFCVPNHQFLSNLSISSLLDKIGLKPLGNIYRDMFNKISRHYHCDPPDVWIYRLDQYGLKVERWWHYFSPKALHTLEWGHYFGLPSYIIQMLFGRWILVPKLWNLSLVNKFTRPIYDEETKHPDGSYTFYIASKIH